ncbi:MAG: bifunctional phosphopantothenoylcysteine decarboxylase/phosphopantothenate--cysteine ligase CoaBC [Candidatus Cloacimonetes bacterium]|nr:bifunctional phosphopantothenoylcysteine decarboxylase/phosphopantothenate--cysteine ligase CoaBC [Candidatus Cloacimonadota bacterium]
MKKPRILLCVCGGIAAYKAIDLASKLYKIGYDIRTVLTEAANKFVSPVNFSAITHGEVYSTLWYENDAIPHINLADWADLIIVAPASANTIAKAAHGIADNLLSSIILAYTKPILWVPAMNVHMYQNQATIDNIALLHKRGHFIIEPDTGLLACAYSGKGKYPPNEELVFAIRTYLQYGRDLKGIKALVSAGATKEAIDPMRFISNRSSGKMGLSLARALCLRGAEVTLVYGAISTELPYYLNDAIEAVSVEEMHKEMIAHFQQCNWVFMCAAVSDYKPESYSSEKIKKGKDLCIKLRSTKDILQELGETKAPGQKLIGFAAETSDIVKNAKLKLQKKNLDIIVANHLNNAGKDTNEITVLSCDSSSQTAQGDKFDLAHKIVDITKKS